MHNYEQFEIYRHALARLERRNQLIIKELRLGNYKTALEYATTPADQIISMLDWHKISSSPKVSSRGQLDLFGGK